MEDEISALKQKIEVLTNMNTELLAFKQEYNSAKQSLNRMSARLKKLCKRLSPTSEIVLEMQKVADDIRELTKKAVDI